LKVANAARYSGHGNISNINDALMFVGLQQIRAMVCIVGITESFPQNKSLSFDYTNFWRHSVGVAVCAKTLARTAGVSPAVGFISGMLHDIGRLIFTMTVPEEFHNAMEYRASHHCQDFEAEQAVLGIDHAMIGAHLARKWNLPPVICTAIEKHHIPDAPPSHLMADLIHVSDVLTHALEFGYIGHPIPPLSERALSRLGIQFSRLKPQLALIECEYQNAILMLN
jgi:putative nucleotidyltransferase with HDIG domain